MPSTDGEMAAGWPFFGQFIAHDITADRSPLGHRADPEQIQNFRTPRANLEGVYGSGPTGSPYLFQKDDPAKLLLGEGGHDVPRNHEGIALVGDQRNDTHLFMSQMQVGVHQDPQPASSTGSARTGWTRPRSSRRRRRATTWHYQWVILQGVPAAARRRPSWSASCSRAARPCFEPGDDPYIPFEFADAAYRYGHSQVRDAYRVNQEFGPVPGLPGPDGLRRGAGGSRDRLVPAIRCSRP